MNLTSIEDKKSEKKLLNFYLFKQNIVISTFYFNIKNPSFPEFDQSVKYQSISAPGIRGKFFKNFSVKSYIYLLMKNM